MKGISEIGQCASSLLQKVVLYLGMCMGIKQAVLSPDFMSIIDMIDNEYTNTTTEGVR